VTRTAVAISGGGHRACLWGLGALLYLADSGRNRQVTSIASVSGGSLANGVVGQRLDYQAATAPEVNGLVGSVSGRLAGRGTVFGWWGTYAYLLLMAASPVAIALLVWRLEPAWWLLALITVAALTLWFVALSLRGIVAGRAFEHTLLRAPGRPRTLEGLHTTLDHVICATDLHAGEHVYFSGSWVCAYRFGLGGAGRLPLRRAVQASAAFPGVFPVAWVRTKRFAFGEAADPKGSQAKFMGLVDGGVYDNMGDQWAHGLDSRRGRWPAAGFREADELIVVNSSAGMAWGPIWRLGVPLVGELLALLRDKSVLFDNGTSVRRRELVSRFDLAAKTGSGLAGALVHIPQSPFDVAEHFAGDATDWPQRHARALAVIAELEGGDADAARTTWSQVARENAAVKTTLVSFSPEVCARLLHHSYVLTMVNLHVVLGYPLLEIPDRQRFTELVAANR